MGREASVGAEFRAVGRRRGALAVAGGQKHPVWEVGRGADQGRGHGGEQRAGDGDGG